MRCRMSRSTTWGMPARVQVVDGLHHGGFRPLGCSKADFSALDKGQRSVEKDRVHTLADSENGVLPSKALSDSLLARDAVAERGDAGIGPHYGFHRVERLLESRGLDRKYDEVSGCRVVRADAFKPAGLAVDGEPIMRMARNAHRPSRIRQYRFRALLPSCFRRADRLRPCR